MAERKASGSKDGRYRNWCCVIYPESAPDGWRDYLDGLHIQWCESPLHNADVNPGTGECKKAHQHLLLMWDGKKSYEQVKEITDHLNAPIPQRCESVRGAVRYMAHMDNPEKHQYSPSDIIGHNGFDVAAQLKATGAARYELVKEMMDWCTATHCTEFSHLIEYASSERYDDWFPLLCDSCAMVVNLHIKSLRHRKEEGSR